MKGTAYSNDYLFLVFNNIDLAGIGDANGLYGSDTAGQLYVSLHQADPGAGGNQSSNEANYTGYARVGVARSGSGWSVAGGQVSNAGTVTFPACGGGTNTLTHFGVGTDASGPGLLLYSGPLAATYFEFTGLIAATTIVAPGNSLDLGDPVELLVFLGASLPGGLATATIYYVHSDPTTGTFGLSATAGGGAITLTTSGSGLIAKVNELSVSSGYTPSFAAGDLIITEA